MPTSTTNSECVAGAVAAACMVKLRCTASALHIIVCCGAELPHVHVFRLRACVNAFLLLVVEAAY